MKLLDLYKEIREDTFSKEQTEKYYDNLSFFDIDVTLELARLEKLEAIFYLIEKESEEKKTEKDIDRKWKVTEDGGKMTLYKAYSKANARALKALQTRIYAKLS